MKMIAKVAFEIPTTHTIVETLFGKRAAIENQSETQNDDNVSNTLEAEDDVSNTLDENDGNDEDMKDKIREILAIAEEEGDKAAKSKVKKWMKDKVGLEDSIDTIKEYKTMHEECHAVLLHFEATQDSFRQDVLDAARDLVSEKFDGGSFFNSSNPSQTFQNSDVAFDYDLENCERTISDGINHTDSSHSSSMASSSSLQTPKKHSKVYSGVPVNSWSACKKRAPFTPPLKRSKQQKEQ